MSIDNHNINKMKQIQFKCSEYNMKELRKQICFLSEEIIDINIDDEICSIYISDTCNEEYLMKKIEILLDKNINLNSLEVDSWGYNKKYFNLDKLESIKNYGEGLIQLNSNALFLFEFFIKQLDKILECFDIKIVKKRYPVLLPINVLEKTGYLHNSPEYIIYCSNVEENLEKIKMVENKIKQKCLGKELKEPLFTLSPSACFHTYMDLQNETICENSVYTFVQNVFRNEGRLNHNEFGRMRDYHVKEIVFIGDEEFVKDMRLAIMNKIKEFIISLNLKGKLVIATDPFIVPKMNRYKKIQILEKTKYEIRLNYSDNEDIAIASFNLHGQAFCEPFNIKKNNNMNTVSGCVGIGVERLIMSFLSQFGENVKNWPQIVKEEYYAK